MAKLSIIIPSRDEKFLTPTIDDIFRNARGEIEVVVILDSNKWPGDWKEVTARHPQLHTIHNGSSRGMRFSINAGVASALSRGAKYIMKTDAHCSFSEGFDEILKADHQPDWVVVPRRGRLDPEAWTVTEPDKPDIDYHYLSFPNDPNDFGGPGLNGKPWNERALARRDVLVDEEMSSQGSCWFMTIDYFNQLELMDEASYGGFWNEFQEIGLKAWLSGGAVMVNKKCKYLHLHKGTKYGRGYRLQESWLKQGAGYTKKWIWNEAWPKQTLPFSWLVEHFWPVPTWPEKWEEILYATRKPRVVVVGGTVEDSITDRTDEFSPLRLSPEAAEVDTPLQIIAATYGIGATADLDVTLQLQSLVEWDSLDIVVSNSTLCPNQNPHRGKRKQLTVTYSIDGGEPITVQRDEKDWLIIGPVASRAEGPRVEKTNSTDDEIHRDGDKGTVVGENEFGSLVQWDDGVPAGRVPHNKIRLLEHETGYHDDRMVRFEQSAAKVESQLQRIVQVMSDPPRTAAALNDYLIRKFKISDRRLRGPMPIELRNFHRNDLAQLFAELGFKRGAEIGVAEGHYSEVLLKANPELELLLVDPWQRYQGNPYAHSQEHQDFSLNETKRKTAPYPNVRIMQDFSMNVVREVGENSLDFVYVDAHHGFDWVMEDLIEWGKRVRSGGIISGDDYYHFKRSWAGVVEAVNAYTLGHRISPWFLIDAPRSVDFFWVKP